MSGAVCTVHIVVNMDFESEERAWGLLGRERYRGELQSQMLAATHQALGPEFDVRSMSLARGSIDILVTIGAVYYALSRYKNFVDSIELLASQLTGVVRRFLESAMPQPAPQVAMSATWEPGPGLVRLETFEPSPSGVAWAYPLLWYIILSHAALLALFIWIMARR
jgi:hypothetical protein